MNAVITTTIYECAGQHCRRRALFGKPSSVRAWRRCAFNAGSVVGYEIARGRRTFARIFRPGSTIDDESFAAPRGSGGRPYLSRAASLCF